MQRKKAIIMAMAPSDTKRRIVAMAAVLLLMPLQIVGLNGCASKLDNHPRQEGPKTMPPTDHEPITSVLHAYEKALNDSDAESATSLYHPEGVFMPLGFPSATGAEEINSAYTGIFSTIRLNITFEIEDIEQYGEIAIATTASRGTVTVLASDLSAPEENRELFVLRTQNDKWLIYRYMFNKVSGPTN